MIETRTLDCGLTLLVEPISSVASCSIHWLVPAGNAYENSDRIGVSTVLSEMLFRGAGSRDSRKLSDDMDKLGLERDGGVSGPHAWLMGTVLAQYLDPALELLTDVICDPSLPSEALTACQSLSQQAIESLEDEPQQEVMLHVRRRHRAEPFNRSGYGYSSVIESVSIEELTDFWKAGFVPENSFIGLAGAIEVDSVVKRLDALLSGWSGSRPEPEVIEPAIGGRGHLLRDSSQVHLGMGWNAPPAGHEDAILERIATRILGGSTSGRLFTEVRQRRSLCYSVSATYRARRDEGLVSLYAGTTPERAAETLEVCGQEIERMSHGVEQEEFARAMIGLRGGTVFNGERTQARAAALVGDQYSLGRVRTMEDRLEELDAITLERLNDYLARRVSPVPTVVTVGPEPIGPDFEEETPLCHH